MEAISKGVFLDVADNPRDRNSPLLPPNPGNTDERPYLLQILAKQISVSPPYSPADSWTQIKTEWANRPVQTVKNLVNSVDGAAGLEWSTAG